MKNLYFSFADEDLDAIRQIEKSLKPWVRQKKILIWHRGLLKPGDDLRKTAMDKIEEANIILIFLSRYYLSSDFPYDEELSRATELRAKKLATIIPVFLSPFRLDDSPLTGIAPIPSNHKALTSKDWPDFDHALSVFSNELSIVIENEEKIANKAFQSNSPEQAFPKGTSSERFQVGLSFASEDRTYVKRVAESLSQKGVSVFFDEFHQVDMWGKDLYQHLNEVYKSQLRPMNAYFYLLLISSFVWIKPANS